MTAQTMAGLLLAYAIYPAWIAAGAADLFCHRRTRLAVTSGVVESALHLLQLGLIGAAALLVILLEVTKLTLVAIATLVALHSYVSFRDVAYTDQRRRITPFVMGGGGYLRQLDEPRTTVETGALFYGGGGARVRLSTAPSGWLSHLAVRADARVVWLRGGVTIDDDRGPAIVATGGLSLAF